jgi:hypothetical protein
MTLIALNAVLGAAVVGSIVFLLGHAVHAERRLHRRQTGHVREFTARAGDRLAA